MNNPALDRYLTSKSCSNTIGMGTIPNSMMLPEQADRFYDMVRDSSRLLQNIREVRTDVCKGQVHRLNLPEIVSEAASSTSCTSLRTPIESMLSYELVKYRSAFNLTSDVLRCNIQKGTLTDLLLEQFRKRIGRDMERVGIMGDTSLPMGDGQPALNNLLGANDGFLKLLCSCVPEENVIDAAGAGLSTELLFAAHNAVPVDYLNEIGDYKFIVGPRTYNKWAQGLVARETPLGDAAVISGGMFKPLGDGVFMVPNWPENLDLGADETDGTTVIFSPLSNFAYFVGMDLQLERERVPRCDQWEFTMHWLADFMVELPEMVVVIKNLRLCGSPWEGCREPYGLSSHNVCL
jgi:hypothetical protein